MIAPAAHQAQLESVQRQLQEIQAQIESMQEFPEIQAFSLEQYQARLKEIEADAYAKSVQAGLLNAPLTPIVQPAILQRSLVEVNSHRSSAQ